MIPVNVDVLKNAANRLLFDMSDEEYAALLDDFSLLLHEMESFSEIEGLEKYEPMTFPFDCSTSYLREDEPDAPLTREEALKNAGSVKDNSIKVPKVVL